MKLLSHIYNHIYQIQDSSLYSKATSADSYALDYGCASGRVMAHFAKKGYIPYGIDDNEFMINEARSFMILNEVSNYKLLQDNFLSKKADLVGKFDLVTILANTYAMILDKKERVTLLNNTYEYLKSDGEFIFYIINNYQEEKNRVIEMDFKGAKLVFELSWQQNSDNRSYFMKIQLDSKSEEHEFKTKILTRNDIEAEIGSSNFKIKKCFGDLEGGEFEEDSKFLGFDLTK